MNQVNGSNLPRERVRQSWTLQDWLWGAILVLLVAIVYWPTLGNGFVGDDTADIKKNLALRSAEGLYDLWFTFGTVMQYYPLTFSTFWAEYHLWGLDPRGYHVVNGLLHAAVAVLVWRLLRRLAVPGAWLAAAIFAVHPVHVESVAWLSERKNLVSALLALGSMLAYFRFSPPEAADAQQPTDAHETSEAPDAADSHEALTLPERIAWGYYALALLLYVASLLSKTATVSVPAVLLVLYWWKRGRLAWRDVGRTVPFFLIGLALSGITIAMEKKYSGASGEEWDLWMGKLFAGGDDAWGLSLVARVLVAGRAVLFYAGKLFWPHPLVCFYPRWTIDPHAWWQFLYPAAAVAVLVGLWLARKRIGRGPLAAALIFAGVLTPVLGFFSVNLFRFTFVADHLQYHASIALIALVVAAAALAVGWLPAPSRWLATVAGAGLLVPLGMVAHQRTHVYKDDVTLDEDLIHFDPQGWEADHSPGVYFQQQRAYHNIAFGLHEQGQHEQALAHFRRAIEIREQLARDNPTISKYQNEVAAYYVDVGLLERKMGRAADAEASFRKAIEIRDKLARDHPGFSDYQEGLAWCYADLAYVQSATGRPTDATESHGKALEIREQLVRDHPASAKYTEQVAASCADIGLLLRDLGRQAEAQSVFREAIGIREKLIGENPALAECQLSLAANYQDLAISQHLAGSLADAEASRGKVIEIRARLARDNPANRKYQNDLAASYVDLGLLERDLGRAADAETSFRAATAIREKLVRSNPAASDYQDGLAWCYVHLAGALQQAGRPADAEVFQRKAMEIREKLPGRDKTQR